jgi:2,3-bisphosphoglycerate-dependent phosphoglycerate mutase
MYKLVLLRHGQSKWNLQNRFTGWTDVGLTVKGKLEAKEAGKELNNNGYTFDKVYCSVLKRAIKTMEICLNEMGIKDIPINYNWRLNERHYGSLQGLNKQETAKKFGDKQVLTWRRSYITPPPKLDLQDKRNPQLDKKYSLLDKSILPLSECLKDTYNRLMPLWNSSIKSDIKYPKKIFIVAHGNSIRALIKNLDNISDKEIVNINIPTGIPLVYELDKALKPVNHYYLGNKKDIVKKTLAVANQGKSN